MNTGYKKQSFWNFLRGRDRVKSLAFFNPLGIKPDSQVQFDVQEHRGMTFTLDPNEPVAEYTYMVDGGSRSSGYIFTDYNLIHLPPTGDTKRLKLRVAETGSALAEGKKYDLLLLALDFSDKFTQGLADQFRLATRNQKWIVEETGEEGDGSGLSVGEQRVSTYRRVNGASRSRRGTIATADGAFESHSSSPVEFLDFVRSVGVDATHNRLEFYFVEMVGPEHYFYMWKGNEINERRISII